MSEFDLSSCHTVSGEAVCLVQQPFDPIPLVNSMLTHAVWAAILHNVPFAPLIDAAPDFGGYDG